MAEALGVRNVAACNVKADAATVLKNIVESPELFRFQLLSNSVLDSFASMPLVEWGLHVGTLLSTALTTFLLVPPAGQVSLAMHVFFGELPVHSLADLASGLGLVGDEPPEDLQGSIAAHPVAKFEGFESVLLLAHARARSGATQVSSTHIALESARGAVPTPFLRCDVTNMTRHVHHHFDYAKDGHTRTYTMRIQVNATLSGDVSASFGDPSSASTTQLSEGVRLNSPGRQYLLPAGAHPNHHQVVDVHLVRDKDDFPIPYVSIYGITLITTLRLGLEGTQRNRLFQAFLRLPLYEDMAPWNVVLAGAVLDVSLLFYFLQWTIPWDYYLYPLPFSIF